MPDKVNAKRQWKLPAKLQVFVWMGLEDHAKDIQHRLIILQCKVQTYQNCDSF